MLEIKPIKTIADVRKAYKLSYDLYKHIDDNFVKFNEDHAWHNLFNAWKSQQCLIGVYKDNVLSGWLLALVSTPFLHSKEKVLSQVYYHTSLTGRDAVQAVYGVHRAMLAHAAHHRIPWVKSSSYLDSNNTFLRILEKDGWTIRGSMAMKRTK
jgi:hypothetical protein